MNPDRPCDLLYSVDGSANDMLVPDLVLCQPCMLLPSLLLLHHDLENVLGLGYRGWVTWRRAKSLWCSSQGHLRSAKSPLVPTALPTFPSKSAPHTLPTSGLPTFPSRHLRAKSTSHPSVDMSCSTWDHCSMCFINACCIDSAPSQPSMDGKGRGWALGNNFRCEWRGQRGLE